MSLIRLPEVLVAASVASGILHAAVLVKNDDGTAIVAARVTFSDSLGAKDEERTDRDGHARAAANFRAIAATVHAPGYVDQTAAVRTATTLIVLQRDPKLVGVVRVATLSPHGILQLPFAVSLLDGNQIRNSGHTTTDALLRGLPGFDRTRSNAAFTNYGQLRVSFAGAGTDRGAVFVDGVPAQDAFGGQIDWVAYPPGMLRRAELLRGGGSALYGANAIGGVMQLYTAMTDAPAAGASGSVAYGAGTRGTNMAQALLELAIRPGASFTAYSSRWHQTYDDFPASFSSPIDTAADSLNNVTSAALTLSEGPTLVRLTGMVADDTQYEGRPNYWESRALSQYSAAFNRTQAQSSESLTFYARDGLVHNVSDQFPTAPGVLRYAQDVPTVENGASVSWRIATNSNDFQLLADTRSVAGSNYQYGSSGKLQNAGGGSQWLSGVALQEMVERGNVSVVAGMRADQVFTFGEFMSNGPTAANISHPAAKQDGAVSPRFGVRVDASPTIALRASIGGGFRAPYLNELVRGFQIGSTKFAPNPDLTPERSAMTSAGTSLFIGRGLLSYDYTHDRVNDAIGFMTKSANLQVRQNIEQTATDGSTWQYALPLGPCARLRAAYTEQRARVIAGPATIVGKQLAFVPDTNASVGVDDANGRFQWGVDATLAGQTYADDLNTEPLNSALLVGFRATEQLGANASLSLSADNATDRVYLSSQDRLGPPSVYMLRYEQRLGSAGSRSSTSCIG
ncbi:MAG TPA: TonB-dependent receptor [Candidatus Baltobacteraceae bacterium]|nr:TonB-dependent receptor [Candidatus Baltobacteraceae bacterium]